MPKTKTYYQYSDNALQQLARKGDERAWEALGCRRIVRLVATNQLDRPKSVPCRLDPTLWAFFQKMPDGPVRMFLEIGEGTSLDQIKQHWGDLQTWRDLLLTWQGPWTNRGDKELEKILFQQLERTHQKGVSTLT